MVPERRSPADEQLQGLLREVAGSSSLKIPKTQVAMVFGSLLKCPCFQGLGWTTSTGAFQPQLLCDSPHFGLYFAHSASPPKTRTPMAPQCIPEGLGVFGKGHVFQDGAKWRRPRVEMQPNLINRTCLPLTHKQDWSITESWSLSEDVKGLIQHEKGQE